jgi:bifunctional non-homologous end joining protein LigD
MAKRLKPLARDTSPFVSVPKTNEPAHWVEPKIVVEAKFIQWTDEGYLRQPVFLGIRDDKPARLVTRERESIQHAAPMSKPKKKAGSLVEALQDIENDDGDGTLHIGSTTLDVTNLKKVFFPRDGYTKGDLLRFYAQISDAILPTMADRPLVLKRFPNGIDGKPFYQQNAPNDGPDGVRIETLGEDERRFVGGSLVTLLYTIQLGAVSVDPWMARVQSIETPDYTVIDLDPGPKATFQRVVQVAGFVKEELDAMGLHGAPKTSGASGIHIYVPLPVRTSEESARLIAQLIATRVSQAHPKETTIERSVKARPADSVYVDYLQNIIGKTVAGVYAVRAVDGAHVSTPLDWDELTDTLTPGMFTIKTLPERLAKRGDLWAEHMARRNTAAALRKLTG